MPGLDVKAVDAQRLYWTAVLPKSQSTPLACVCRESGGSMFTMRFDMRAPKDGAPRTQLYAAALDMCAWAEDHGCLAVVICEHHGSEDGYLPAPLVFASAVAARTQRLLMNLVVLLPLY